MKKGFVVILFFLTSGLATNCVHAQCHFIPSTSASVDTVGYTFFGGTFASYGCAPIDPTFWLAGNGISVTCTFVTPQDHPAIRVWGMNDDDSALVLINTFNYYMDTTATASYAPKVVCGVSPGPDGVVFRNGRIVGANSNMTGNYSYSDVTINTSNVTSIKVTGISGAGWGFAGVVLDCAAPVAAFATNPTSVCPGTCVSFTNLSVNGSQWQWIFNGANPSSDTSQSPVNICYYTPGSYDVTLIASNGTVSDTLTLNNYITVYPYPPPQGIMQSGDTLFANAGAVSYQWYHNGNPITGATEYFYVAPESGDYNVVATDSNGCEVEAAIFDVTAGLQSTDDSQQLIIYPNPVDDKFTMRSRAELKIGTAVEISVYNIVGEKIVVPLLRTTNDQLTADVRQLKPGIYFIEIATAEKTFRAKFLKQ